MTLAKHFGVDFDIVEGTKFLKMVLGSKDEKRERWIE